MRLMWALGLVMAATSPSSAQTATFRVDGVTSTPLTAVATIQPRPGAPGYSWLRIYFYSSLTAAERRQAERGGIDAHRTHWAAVLQFSLDTSWTIWQIDLSVPGHACTIAASDRDATRVVQAFQFENGRLRLRTTGAHVCDMRSIGVPNQRFEWDVSTDTRVVESRSSVR
jgi:hypothetical protein